jgi:transcriptional regulator with XRE-family HTH domain
VHTFLVHTIYIFAKIVIMKGVKNLREFLNCGQRDMALLLGVSSSNLSMYESGLRDLPEEVNLRLADMMVLAQQIKQRKQPVLLPVSDRVRAAASVKKRIQRSEELLYRQKEALDKMTVQYRDTHQALNNLLHFKPSGKKASRREVIWFEARINIEKASLQRCNPEMQCLLKMKISGLQAEIMAGKQLLKGF